MNIALFDKLLASPIAFHRVFATISGGVAEGLFLSQAYYWSLRTTIDGEWFYKTQQEWCEETALNRREQETARKRLIKLGILEEKREGMPSQLYYRVNRSVLYDLIYSETGNPCGCKIVQSDNLDKTRLDKCTNKIVQNNIQSIYTENTSENTLPPTPQRGKEGEKKFGFEINQEITAQSSTSLLSQPEATQFTNKTVTKADIAPMRVDPFFNRRRDPKDISWDWLPDGPWRTEDGKLDAEFWTAVAENWVKEHGGNIHEKKKNVLKHFRNEPTNLPIEWEWYQTITIHRAANIQTRKMHGFDTVGDEQAMMKHTGALKSLPLEMRVTATIAPDELLSEIAPYAMPSIDQSQVMPAVGCANALAGANDVPSAEGATLRQSSVTTDVWDIVAAQTDAWEQKQIAPEGADNPEAYKSVKQVINPEVRDYWAELDQKRKQPDASDAASLTSTSQPIKERIGNLAVRKSMPRASDRDKKDQTRLSHWNNLLATGLPSVMADAERQALKAGYIIVDGQVVEPEF